jgi:hypothetical protein
MIWGKMLTLHEFCKQICLFVYKLATCPVLQDTSAWVANLEGEE